jgi:agmatine/peptidylarginine deiminase
MVARALLDANDTIETYWRNWGRAVDNEMRLAKEKAEWKSKAERAEAALAALRQAVCRAETIIISSVASIREDGEDYYSGERALEILHEMTAQHMGETE